MGLAAPKNKIKLSNDPNNTAWTNNTNSFGHRIMKSQGWQPGQYLGAKDAPHAEFHTAANASHIRVSIKDDNLGLGAKVGSGVGHGECTGLDAFKNILGRLNGKDEAEIAKEQQSRDDLKRAIYTERRWGSIRFVPGGFLIGDKIENLIEAEAERIRNLRIGSSSNSSSPSSSESEEEAEPPTEKPRKSKKRKIEHVDEEMLDVVAIKVKKSKKKNKTVAEEQPGMKEEIVDVEVKKSKKSKKDRRVEEGQEVTTEESEKKKRKEARKQKRLEKEA
ncbi:hypothetical protein BGZ60DRAFT_410923, partial [Tricladium varicosporioides]